MSVIIATRAYNMTARIVSFIWSIPVVRWPLQLAWFMKYAGMIYLMIALEDEAKMDGAYQARRNEIITRQEQERRDATYDDERRSVLNILKMMRRTDAKGTEEERDQALENIDKLSQVVNLVSQKERNDIGDEDFIAGIKSINTNLFPDTSVGAEAEAEGDIKEDPAVYTFTEDRCHDYDDKDEGGDDLDAFTLGLMDFLPKDNNRSIEDLTLQSIISAPLPVPPRSSVA